MSNHSLEHVSQFHTRDAHRWLTDPPQLKAIIDATSVVPAANQIERHPLLRQDDLIAFCKEKNIHITAYSVRDCLRLCARLS